MNTQNLIDLRDKKGCYQKEIAKQIGLSVQAYCNYEKGIREPDISTLIKLAEYFNVTIDYLVGRNDEKEYKIAKNSVENGILGAMTQEEIELVQSYRLLDDTQKIAVKGVMQSYTKSWKSAKSIG